MAIRKINSRSLGDGSVQAVDLDGNAVTPAAVSDVDNTSTGQFTLPKGTTAQRPVSPFTGAQRYNTDLGVYEYYNGTGWLKVSSVLAILDSVTGTVYAGFTSTLTLTGSGFLSSNLIVNFEQSSDGINENVTVTPTSDTSATVTVPSGVYNNVTAGNTVSIRVTNSDSNTSSIVNKLAYTLPSGGSITTSGNYRIHDFTSSSTFVTNGFAGNVEYVVQAGGASGGQQHGGGGGAGGYRTSVPGQTSGRGTSAESALTVTASTTYDIEVGAGGASTPASAAHPNNGSNGGNSWIADVTASTKYVETNGGGYGAGWSTGAGGTAGAGGCGGGTSLNTATGGSGTAAEGYDGGGSGGTYFPAGGGGGGGIGGAGESSFNLNRGGNGGAGLTTNITGATLTFGGGGGAGSHSPYGIGTGTDGGGNGGLGNNGDPSGRGGDGAVNTGSGGGGSGAGNATTGQGGSGRVIIRYDISAL